MGFRTLLLHFVVILKNLDTSTHRLLDRAPGKLVIYVCFLRSTLDHSQFSVYFRGALIDFNGRQSRVMVIDYDYAPSDWFYSRVHDTDLFSPATLATGMCY